MGKKKDYLPEFEPPRKKLNTERDAAIKNLYNKQKNTEINLEKILGKEKEFKASAKVLSLSSEHQGSNSLQELMKITEKIEEKQFLCTAGLNKAEITLYEDYLNGGFDYLKTKHKAINTCVLKDQVMEILERISKYKKEQNGEASTNSTKLEHPMDTLKEEEQRITSINPKLDLVKLRRKARKLQNRIKKLNEPVKTEENIAAHIENKKNSKWDQKQAEESPKDKKQANIKEKRAYTCKSQNYYTIKNNEIVNINDVSNFQISGRLKQDEINVKYPKFNNHEFGFPAKTLYIKNLPNLLKEINLKILFPSLKPTEFKILVGKMRGQAFLSFDTVKDACGALEMLHGTVINDKVIIVQYGKSKC